MKKQYTVLHQLVLFFKKEKIARLVSYGLIFIITSSWCFYYYEHGHNEKIQAFSDSLWWLIVTLTTVGYGDIAPQTLEGRMIAIFSMIFGIGFLGAVMANITSSLVTIRNKELQGMKAFHLKNHAIICGYHPRKLENLLLELRLESQFVGLPIVLISNTIQENPLPEEYKLYFIRGDMHDERTLIKAGIHDAHYLIVLAESDKLHEDEHTILTIMLAEQLNPKIYSIAELMSSTKKPLLGKTRCNEIISSSDISINLVAKALQDPGSTKIMDELLTNTRGHKLYKSHIPQSCHNKTFLHLAYECLTENRIALGIEKEGTYTLNPHKDTILQAEDFYFYISDTRQK